jgi:hypothetical protein
MLAEVDSRLIINLQAYVLELTGPHRMLPDPHGPILPETTIGTDDADGLDFNLLGRHRPSPSCNWLLDRRGASRAFDARWDRTGS